MTTYAASLLGAAIAYGLDVIVSPSLAAELDRAICRSTTREQRQAVFAAYDQLTGRTP